MPWRYVCGHVPGLVRGWRKRIGPVPLARALIDPQVPARSGEGSQWNGGLSGEGYPLVGHFCKPPPALGPGLVHGKIGGHPPPPARPPSVPTQAPTSKNRGPMGGCGGCPQNRTVSRHSPPQGAPSPPHLRPHVFDLCLPVRICLFLSASVWVWYGTEGQPGLRWRTQLQCWQVDECSASLAALSGEEIVSQQTASARLGETAVQAHQDLHSILKTRKAKVSTRRIAGNHMQETIGPIEMHSKSVDPRRSNTARGDASQCALQGHQYETSRSSQKVLFFFYYPPPPPLYKLRPCPSYSRRRDRNNFVRN